MHIGDTKEVIITKDGKKYKQVVEVKSEVEYTEADNWATYIKEVIEQDFVPDSANAGEVAQTIVDRMVKKGLI